MFGYGSLAAAPGAGPATHGAGAFVAELPGFTRVWGVAMDNRRDLPGYKYYTRPGGYRPSVYVAFLDLAEVEPAPSGTPRLPRLPRGGGRGDGGSAPTGLCLPVDGPALARLDDRERNYRRVDVSASIPRAGGRVWAYIGTEEGRERLQRGRRLGTAVVDAVYLHAVRDGFRALGEEGTARGASLCPRPLPVVELVRHDLT